MKQRPWNATDTFL